MNNRTSSRTGPLTPVRLWQISLLATALILMALLTANGIVGAEGTDGPAAPANLTATPGNGEVALTWDTPNDLGITGYQYRVSADGGATWNPDWTDIGESGAATTSHTVTGLTNGTNYEIHVRAMEGSNAGAHSDVNAVPYLDVPKAPRNVEATRSDGSITLSWLPPNNSVVDRYEVRYAGKGDKLSSRSWTSAGNVTQYTLPVANGYYGRTWKFQVRAVNESGGGKGTRVTSKPPELTAAPEDFSASATSGASVELSWTPANLEETRGWVYRVKSGETKGKWTELTEVTEESDGSRSATVSAASPCSSCVYQLKAYNDVSRSPMARDQADD